MNEIAGDGEKSVIHEFTEVLVENQIPKNQIPFWELWVKQYLKYCEAEYLPVSDTKHIDLFLAHLQGNNRKPWQIEQAQRACSIYLQLLQKSDSTTPSEAASVIRTKFNEVVKSGEPRDTVVNCHEKWETLVKQTENTLRVKHYAKNTLEHYLYWVKEERCHRRYHIHETTFQRALNDAAEQAQIPRRVKSHMLRHTFSIDLLAAGYDIRQIQDLLGHTDVRTTMIYTHAVRPDAKPIKSPLDLKGKVEAEAEVEVEGEG